jgi:hypothetical protein
MKTLKLMLLIIIASLFSSALLAQVSVNINVGVPRGVKYYYLQDIEAYYDIPASMYIYLSGGRWIRARSLPSSYGHYDFNNGHRVEIRDYRGSRPYSYFNQHRANFPKGNYGQEKKYWSAKEYKGQGNKNKNQGKEYKNAVKSNNKGHGNNGNGRGNGKGQGNGRGNGNGHGNGGGNGHGNGGGNGHGKK